MTDGLFRHEAIDAQRQRLTGTVIAAVPPGTRVYTGVIVAVMGVAVLTLLFGSYASSVPVRGIVTHDRGVVRVAPRTAAEVRRVLVREGQQVAAGAPLVELGLAQGAGGLSDQIGEVDRQIGEVDRQIAIARSAAAGEVDALTEQRRGLTETLASLERQRGIARDQVGLAGQAVARAERLAREGAGAQRQVDGARAELLARRAEAEALSERIITTRATITDMGFRLGQGGLAAGRTLSQLQVQRAGLASERDALARSDRLTLSAPIAGIVGDVVAEPGRSAGPDVALVTILPPGGTLEAWFYGSTQAVGFARPGQPVRLRFDAFPFQRYGSGRGTVVAISRSAVDAAAIDPALGITDAAFRVRVRIDTLGSDVATAAGIRPGMTLSADLVTERRPLWALLFAPIRESIVR